MIQSPYSMKMTQATPLTGKMEMHNWQYDKIGPSRSNINAANRSEGTLNFPQGLERFVCVQDTRTQSQIFNKELNQFANKLNFAEKEDPNKTNNNYVMDERKREMMNLYLRILEEMLTANERKYNISNFKEVLIKPSFHRSQFVCCIETFYFIRNINIISTEKILDLYEIEPVEFWRVQHPYMRYDQRMPSILRKRMLDIEISQLSHLAWRKNSSISMLIQSVDSDKENDSINNNRVGVGIFFLWIFFSKRV